MRPFLIFFYCLILSHPGGVNFRVRLCFGIVREVIKRPSECLGWGGRMYSVPKMLDGVVL